MTLPLLGGDDTFVFESHAQTLSNKTLTQPTITSPRIQTSIDDENGAGLIDVSATASAANNLSIVNAIANQAPVLTAAGTDTNINVSITGKGTGSALLGKAAYGTSTIQVNGGVSDTATHIICNKATTLFVTLADGTTDGEYKIFTNKGAGNATVTPTNFAQGTSFTLQQFEGCSVVWDGSNWYLIGNQSTVTIL